MSRSVDEPRRIAVFCPNMIGDTVMATPALRALRRRFPAAHIAGVIKPSVAPTLAGAPWLDEEIHFDPRSKQPEYRTLAVIRRLRAGRFELGVLMPNSHRSALVAWLGGIKRRVGYGRGGRGLLLTDRLQAPLDRTGRRLPTPAVAYFLELTKLVGCEPESPRLQLFTTETDEQAADRAWRALGLPFDEPVVCLNNGGAYGPAKSWPVEHFAVLARRLAEELGASVLVLCGPAERASAEELVARAKHPRVVSLAEQPLSIGLSKACVKRSAMLITTDSGPRHFATAFDVPVVTLFGPTHIAWTRTYHTRALHVVHPVPCGPCQRPTCPLGHHRCMRELEPAAVFAAACRLLGRDARTRALVH